VSEQRDAAKGGHVINITFRQIECLRCHAMRVATQPCPDCGIKPDPREADPVLQRRSALVADVMSALDRPATTIADLELGEAMHEAAALPGRVLDALAKVSPKTPDAQDLIAAVVRIRQLADWASHDALRPWTNHKRAFGGALQLIDVSVRGFLRAFEARTPREAQLLARAAQCDLDSAAAAAAEIGDRIDAMAAITDVDRHNWLDALSEVALGVKFGMSGEPLLSVASAAESEIAEVTGVAQVSPGTAIAASLAIVPARALYDFDNSKAIAGECLSILRAEPDRFRAVASSASWRAGETQTQQVALDAVDTLLIVLDAEQLSSRQVVRSLLQHVQDVVEGPVRHLTATLLAVATGEPYDALVRNYPTQSLARVAQGSAATFAAGFDAAIRNASAHLDFEVDEQQDEIVLSVRKDPRRMTAEVFGDALLRVAESVNAAALAIVVAADEMGIDIPTPDVASLGVVADAMPRAMLRLLGWEDVGVVIEDAGVAVTARGALPALIPTAGALLVSLPDRIADLEFTVEASGGARHVFRAPLGGFREYRDTKSRLGEGVEAELTFVIAVSRCTLDGARVLSQAAIRHYLAMQAGPKINGPLPDAIQRLRLVREAAASICDTEAVEVFSGAMTAVRLVAQRLAPDAMTARHLDTLVKWESERHKNPFGLLSN